MAPSPAKEKDSPAWKNPRDMIKRHFKRKNASSSRCLLMSSASSSSSLFAADSLIDFDKLTTAYESKLTSSNPVRNPFKRSSPRKRRRTTENSAVKKPGIETSSNDILWDSQEAMHGFPEGSVFNDPVLRFGSTSAFADARDGEQSSSHAYPVDFSDLDAIFRSPSKRTPSAPTKPTVIVAERRKATSIPVDLRLATKLRIESSAPFPWMDAPGAPGKCQIVVTGTDRDAAVRLFCTASRDEPLKEESMSSTAEQRSWMTFLEASTLYWQFPDIPWMCTFPRLESAPRPGAFRDLTAPSLQTLGPKVVDTLAEQWLSAFEHLFHSWRKGSRRLFYVCCPSCTIVFVKESIGTATDNISQTAAIDSAQTLEDAAGSSLSMCSSSTMSQLGSGNPKVVITPTTLGFRQILRDEEITFEMPLKRGGRNSSSSRLSASTLEEKTELENSNTYDRSQSHSMSFAAISEMLKRPPRCEKSPAKRAVFTAGEDGENESPWKRGSPGEWDQAAWMKDIGISPDSTRRLTRQSSMSVTSSRSLLSSSFHLGDASKESPKRPASVVDESSKATVVVSDPGSIQALFNVINTSRIFRTVTGPQAGLPPTLIAAEPFLNSTLKSLSKSSQISKKGGDVLKYICEFGGGPIMPHNLSLLTTFLASCPTLKTKDSRVTVHAGGRSAYAGLNQGAGYETLTDFSELEFVVEENLFYY